MGITSYDKMCSFDKGNHQRGCGSVYSYLSLFQLIPKLFRYFIRIFEHNYLLGVVDLGWGNAILANHPEDVL